MAPVVHQVPLQVGLQGGHQLRKAIQSGQRDLNHSLHRGRLAHRVVDLPVLIPILDRGLQCIQVSTHWTKIDIWSIQGVKLNHILSYFLGSAGNWQNRYPSQSGGYPVGDSRSWGPQGAPPRMPPGAQPPQWSSGPPGPSAAGERPNYPYAGGPGMQWRGGMRPPYRPQGPPGAPGGPSVGPPGMMGPGRQPYPGRGSRNLEFSYPPGSVEATQPLMMKRRKYTKVDVQPVEGWR